MPSPGGSDSVKTAFSASLLMLLMASYAQGQDDQNAAAQPTTAAPIETPPPPPEEPPAPPEQVQMQAPQATVPQSGQQVSTGQWVYTYQYGWLWMPYGAQYSYEPSTVGAYPYAYVYYPIYGWTWLTSPWVWGLGPLPYFGRGPKPQTQGEVSHVTSFGTAALASTTALGT